MFEKIVLRRAESGQPISAGHLAEAMLYYQHVHIIIDRGTLSNLVRQMGVDGLLSVIWRDDVSAIYCDEMLGTHTESAGVSQYHNYVAFSLSGSAEGQKLDSLYARLKFDLIRDGVGLKEAQRFTTAFLNRVPFRAYSSDHFIKGGIPKAATDDLQDQAYILKAVRQFIKANDGESNVPAELKFDIIESDLGKFVFTNIDLKSLNERRSRYAPAIEPLTVAHLLTSVLEARADLALASYYEGDFVTSSVTSAIIQLRHAEVLRRSGLNTNSRRQFSEIFLPDMPSVAEVIDSGDRSFDEFIEVIDEAVKFKKWLRSLGTDEHLVRAYLRDISSEGWIGRLPGKSLRYMLTTGVGAWDPVAGIVVGLADAFIVDKLFAGWKPNHFISSNLSPFLQKR